MFLRPIIDLVVFDCSIIRVSLCHYFSVTIQYIAVLLMRTILTVEVVEVVGIIRYNNESHAAHN